MSRLHGEMNRADLNNKIEALLSQMTLEEKVGQMTQYDFGYYNINIEINHEKRNQYEEFIQDGLTGSIFNIQDVHEANRLQRVAVEKSRLGIPILIGRDVIHGYRTIFPIPLAQSSSWNPQLVQAAAKVSAREASTDGIHWVFAPMVDVTRDPRWGRIAESPGEDTFLAEVMASALVKGVEDNQFNDRPSVASCPKHFAAYGATESGRDYNTVDISERVLREVYLPPFKAAFDAGAQTVMAAFNEVNGVPACANSFLLRKILREEWGFEGVVVSDYNAVFELLNHGLAASEEEACMQSILAGLDIDMDSGIYQKYLPQLVRCGKVPERLIDDAVRRILALKFALGLFDHPYISPSERDAELLSQENQELALELARQSVVLLKNERNLLPLDPNVQTIAVIGPLAHNREHPLGPWAFDGRSENVVTVLEGIRKKVRSDTRVTYAQGCDLEGDSDDGFAEAIQVACNSDVVVMVVGEGEHMSGEAHSRSSLGLPGVQQQLLKVIHETQKPMVVVVMNGRPLVMNWMDENVSAILEVWHLGIQSGTAIGDILFGSNNPSGKLPVSFPRSLGQVPIYYNRKNTGRPPEFAEGHASNYLDVPVTPLYPFGYGLSYTEFKYGDVEVEPKVITPDGQTTVRITLTNSGDHAGEEVVQLYVRDMVGSVTRPVKELKGFQRVFLNPGEQMQISFTLNAEQLKFYDADMRFRAEPGEFQVWVGPDSTRGESQRLLIVAD